MLKIYCILANLHGQIYQLVKKIKHSCIRQLKCSIFLPSMLFCFFVVGSKYQNPIGCLFGHPFLFYLTYIPDLYYLFLILVLCFISYYSFCFISFIVNKYNNSKSLWCYLLFYICCYYPYMLRLNLMNYFASVRYYLVLNFNSFCTDLQY